MIRNTIYKLLAAASLALAGLCQTAMASDSDTYLVIDLSEGINAAQYPVSYTNAAPVGGWTNSTYKTSKLILRKISRDTFLMGSPTNEAGRVTDGSENQRSVTISNDYYIGVFETTKGQWNKVVGGETDNSVVPKDLASAALGYSQFLDTLRTRTTNMHFDLPDEAQWEYACRAGSTNAYCFGSDTVQLGTYAWYSDNSDSSVHPVGSRQSNAWGLYDMHGNLAEACWKLGSASDNWSCGGNFLYSGVYECRSAIRVNYSVSATVGFRVCLTVPLALYTLTVSNGTASATSCTNGQVVAIAANPPAAFKVFDRWTGDTQTVANVWATNTTVQIQGSNVTVTATYRDAPYTLTVINGSGDGQYARGDLVPIVADTAPTMQVFDHWKVVPDGVALGVTFVAANASTTLAMPGMDLELTAIYTNIPTYTLTVVGGAGSGSYTNGQRVAITAAAPSAHSTFLWTGNTATVADVSAWETTLTMPAASVTVTATYPAALYPLTVTGGLGSGSYTNGQVVTVTATNAPSAWHTFDVWTGDTNAVADVYAVTTTVAVAGATRLAPAYRPTPMPANRYMIVDLTASQTNAAVSYMDEIPEDGWTDDYKTDKMVLRKIPAGTFKMGSPANEVGRSTEETQHAVTLTQAFYIGVFEVTQAQWDYVAGNWPSFFSNEVDRATHPVEKVSYVNVRGATNGSKWPASTAVESDSFVGKLRAKTGDAGFDLPAEAQWEYACRAGTTNAYAGALDDMAVYAVNSSGTTWSVGQKLPNAWGLYDMHGNVEEMCLDWYAGDLGSAAQADPKGATGSMMGRRTMRGGAYSLSAAYCRSAYRGNVLPTNTLAYIGLRMSRTVGATYALTVIDGSVNTGGLFFAGTKIPVGAVLKGPEWTFSKWVVQPANSKLGSLFSITQSETVVTMPTNAVVLTATYGVSSDYTILTVAGGTGSGSYTNGRAVTVSADAPPAWYVFDRWTGDTNGVADVTASVTAVHMTGGQVGLAATYRPRDDLPADVNWLTVIGNGVTNGQLVQAGTGVTVTAAAAPSGKVFGWWNVSPAGTALGSGFDASAAQTTLVMPTLAVTVTALYVTNPGTTRGYADVRLTDQAGVALAGATWSPDGKSWYPAGICPLKPAMYTFACKTPGVNWVTPVKKTVTVKSAVTNIVSGVFQWVPVVTCQLVKGAATDTVTLSPTNGQVLVGKSVTLTAKPATASVFVSWEDGNGTAARTVAPSTNATYTATFRLKASYTQPPVLSAAPAAGTVGVAFSTAVGINELPATFAAKNLPAGLALNTKTGVIAGVPALAGIYAATVIAKNPNNLASTTTVQIAVAVLAPQAQGTFTGYAGTELADTNRSVKGLFTMTVSSVGKITAKVTAQTASYSFATSSWAEVALDGVYRVTLRTAKGETLTVEVNSADGSLTGVVTNGAFGVSGLAIAGQRNAFLAKTDAGYVAATNELAHYKGYYTVALPVVACTADGTAGNLQDGTGYMTLTVKDGGAVALTGKLAEGTTFSSSGTLLVDGEGGYVPLLVPLYTARGAVSGLLKIILGEPSPASNRVEVCDGEPLAWRYPGKTATATEDRFDVSAAAAGAYYDKLINVRAHYMGAGVVAEDQVWEVPLAFTSTGAAYLASGTNNPAKATLSVVSATGLFSGAFNVTVNATARSVSYFGVLTRQAAADVGEGTYVVPQTVTVGTVSYAVKPSFTVTIE